MNEQTNGRMGYDGGNLGNGETGNWGTMLSSYHFISRLPLPALSFSNPLYTTEPLPLDTTPHIIIHALSPSPPLPFPAPPPPE